MKVVRFNKEDRLFVNKFLLLPENIYIKDELTTSKTEELSIIKGTHALSSYFEIQGFLVLNEEGNAIARCIITIYKNSKEAYIGYFESVNNTRAALALFEETHKYCKENNINKVIGPVDASFWIRYRMKTSGFGKPFTGEPYNKDYYLSMFQKAGYKVVEEFISNKYSVIDETHENKLLQRRLRESQKKGYEIKNPKKGELDKVLEDLYDLLIKLYKDFPIFKTIDKVEFLNMFSGLKRIADLSMIQLAYFEGKLVAFSVTLPNYGELLSGKMNIWKMIKVLKRKKVAKEYIVLYLGADDDHLGLGAALVEITKEECKRRKATSIGALIKKGKVSATYFDELIEETLEYALLEYNLL